MSEEKKYDFYWSRIPRNFINKLTGEVVFSDKKIGPSFTGTVREWYETLVETIIDASGLYAAGSLKPIHMTL